jgi:hypothetical protein
MIQINYTPLTIEDFERACVAVQKMNLPALRPPVVGAVKRDEAVSIYCEKKGNKKYYRTPEGTEKGLTPLEDLKLRAQAGDMLAVEALAGSEQESETDDEGEEIDGEFTLAPSDGKAY